MLTRDGTPVAIPLRSNRTTARGRRASFPPVLAGLALLAALLLTVRAPPAAALLTLASGVDHAFTVKGKGGAGGTVLLSLAGDPSDPAAKAIRAKATVTPLEGGWARIDGLSGKAYGQTVAW